MKTTLVGSAWMVLVGFVSSSMGAEFYGLGALDGYEHISAAYAVSGDGKVVVGVSHSGLPDATQAFRWTVETGMVGLGFLPGEGFPHSFANGTSFDGSITVGKSSSDDGLTGAVWEDGGVPPVLDVGNLGSPHLTLAFDVSPDGTTVVGMSSSPSGYEAFRWTESGGIESLGDLPGVIGVGVDSRAYAISADESTVVGYSFSDFDEAFRWTEDEGMVGLGDLPGGGLRSEARDVSGDGSVIVGGSHSADSLHDGVQNLEAFRWTEADGMVGLGDLPGGPFYSEAWGTSADGSVVVGMSKANTGSEAFRWTELDGMEPVEQLLVEAGVDITGWHLDFATGISADGNVIVGFGRNPNGDPEAWMADLSTPIPEPSAALLVAGMAGLLLTLPNRRCHQRQL